MTIMSMTQGPKLPSGWTCPNSWPSTKPFQMNGHVNCYKKKMKWEESAMLSISTPNTPDRSKTVTKAILEHDQHSLKRQKLEIISTSLSQFIWFPRFHSLNSMHLLVHPMQFSIYSLHDVADTLKNPTSLFTAISKVCHFFSISSPNFIHSNNQSR